MTSKELINKDPSRKDFEGLNFYNCVFENMELNRYNFAYSTFTEVEFKNCNLNNSNFTGCNFYSINFSGSIINNSFFNGATFHDENDAFVDCQLNDVIFSRSNFYKTLFLNSSLKNANFSCATMNGTIFQGKTDLSNICVYNATSGSKVIFDYSNCIVSEYVLNHFYPLVCPEEGSFIAWKNLHNGTLAKLLIPEDAKRSSGEYRECRADKVIVVELFKMYSGKRMKCGYSIENKKQRYDLGSTVKAVSWDDNRFNSSTYGITFFMTKQEAEEFASMLPYPLE